MNIDELKQRAATGDAEAMCELGKAYECGRDVVVNLWEAVKWYRLAAEQGQKYAKKKVLEVERRIEKGNKKESHPKKDNSL